MCWSSFCLLVCSVSVCLLLCNPSNLVCAAQQKAAEIAMLVSALSLPVCRSVLCSKMLQGSLSKQVHTCLACLLLYIAQKHKAAEIAYYSVCRAPVACMAQLGCKVCCFVECTMHCSSACLEHVYVAGCKMVIACIPHLFKHFTRSDAALLSNLPELEMHDGATELTHVA